MLYGDYACRIMIRPLLFTVGPSDDFRAGMKEGRSARVGFTGVRMKTAPRRCTCLFVEGIWVNCASSQRGSWCVCLCISLRHVPSSLFFFFLPPPHLYFRFCHCLFPPPCPHVLTCVSPCERVTAVVCLLTFALLSPFTRRRHLR